LLAAWVQIEKIKVPKELPKTIKKIKIKTPRDLVSSTVKDKPFFLQQDT
jgi:hypothetical protein